MKLHILTNERKSRKADTEPTEIRSNEDKGANPTVGKFKKG